MRFHFLWMLFLLAGSCFAQRECFHALRDPQVVSDQLPAPKYLQEHVVDGKLRLSLHDAIVAALMNNSEIHLQQLDVANSKFSLLAAHAPFDPSLQASFDVTRSTSPATTDLDGTLIPSSLTQTAAFAFDQMFETGTQIHLELNGLRFSTNNSFAAAFNPSFSSGVNIQITQPLLRNRWLFANRAPIVVARHNLQISRANFEAQLNDAIQILVERYWSVVQARGNLEVQRKSQEAADALYKRQKRALELGALPPLDIYQSESQAAARRVGVIQAEYQLKDSEDRLRQTLGALADPLLTALDLELTEVPASEEELVSADIATTLKEALEYRPEFEVRRQLLANDDTNIRLAHNDLLPELSLQGTYAGNGVAAGANAGLRDSLNQAFTFGYPLYEVSLNLNLPLRNRHVQAELGNALVSRRRNLYAERQLREQITLECLNAVHQLEQAKLSLAASREALDFARKNLAAQQRKLELGSDTGFYILDAQTEVARAEQNVLGAKADYQIAVAAVQHATGKMLEPYRVQITEMTR